MEIINIEARTFEAMLGRFESFVQKAEKLVDRNKSKELDGWLDNQDVCLILNVNPNTLQYLRDKENWLIRSLIERCTISPKMWNGLSTI